MQNSQQSGIPDYFDMSETGIDFNVNPHIKNQVEHWEDLKRAFTKRALPTFVISMLAMEGIAFLLLLDEKFHLVSIVKNKLGHVKTEAISGLSQGRDGHRGDGGGTPIVNLELTLSS